MKFQDLFIPRWRHSNPDVRAKAVARIKDLKLLEQIASNDESERVRNMAATRLTTIKEEA